MQSNTDSPFKSPSEREVEREAKREAVLRAAVQMFNERGFYSTTFDEVAARLGVSKPTIYHYLGNKEEVLLECVSRGIAELKEAAEMASAAPGSGLDRLKAFLIRYAQINMDDFGRCVIRTPDEGLSPEGSQQFRGLKRDVDTALRNMVQDAVSDGSIVKGDVKIIAFTLAGALNWPARWYKPDYEGEPETIARAMVELLIKGLLPIAAGRKKK